MRQTSSVDYEISLVSNHDKRRIVHFDTLKMFEGYKSDISEDTTSSLTARTWVTLSLYALTTIWLIWRIFFCPIPANWLLTIGIVQIPMDLNLYHRPMTWMCLTVINVVVVSARDTCYVPQNVIQINNIKKYIFFFLKRTTCCSLRRFPSPKWIIYTLINWTNINSSLLGGYIPCRRQWWIGGYIPAS